MTTKKEYGDALRDALDTDINFENLTKEDLIKLTEMLAHPENLLEGLSGQSDRPIDRVIDIGKSWYEKSPGPIAKTLREVLSDAD